jgi:HD-GYP domain-containing protein (c-di-GMP phosphodiesterase class II)
MRRSTHQLSIFSQPLDRAAFVAYFLGAVVPFLALAYVVNAYVLPKLPDGPWSLGLVALTLSIGVLSAAAFLLLRRVTGQTLARMQSDNHRLEALLDASARLANAPHEIEVATAAATCAQRLAHAQAAFVVTTSGGGPPKLEAVAGDRALFAPLEARLGDLLAQALHEKRAVMWGPAKNGALAAGALLAIEEIGGLAVLAAAGRRLEPADLRALTTLAQQSSVAARRAQLVDSQRNFFVHVTDLLVAALDTHMDLQAGHARRVAQLSNRIGRELGLDEARRQRLHFAALLHDVGMLRIDPQRAAEARIARQHPALGHRMLAPILLWQDIAPFVLHHHEWFDGTGYPDQLAGDAIPLESRIIGVAEAFDSMTSASSYQPAVEHDEAIRRIEEGNGTQFDPAVVRVFLELARRGDLDLA